MIPESNELVLKPILVLVKCLEDIEGLWGGVVECEILSLTLTDERISITVSLEVVVFDWGLANA